MATGDGPRLGVVVPVFDEAGRLVDYGKRLVDFALRLAPGSELVFVDDGSTDGTPERIEELLRDVPGAPARLVRRPHRGKGASVAAGLRTLDTPLRGFCDLDLSTPLDDLVRIAGAAARSGGLAIGSRDLTASRLVQAEGPVRETLGRAYNRLLQATVTPGVVDTQCGAKVASGAVWDAVLAHCQEEGFAWDAEVVAVAQALGIEVVQVPIDWRHDERSKVNVGRDGMAMVVATPRIWRSMRRAAAARAPVEDVPVAASAPTSGEVFDDRNAALLGGSDRTHWWFRSKAALVATALRRTATPRPERGWLVDLGGGAGGVTAMLGWPPDRVAVLEGNAALAGQAHRVHGLTAVRTSVHEVPLAEGAAEVVCLLDVIEHLHEPAPSAARGRPRAGAGRPAGGHRAGPPVAVERGRRAAGPRAPLHPAGAPRRARGRGLRARADHPRVQLAGAPGVAQAQGGERWRRRAGARPDLARHRHRGHGAHPGRAHGGRPCLPARRDLDPLRRPSTALSTGSVPAARPRLARCRGDSGAARRRVGT